jgi:hypothetical protein
LISMLSPSLSEGQWSELQKVFVAVVAKIAGLAQEHPRDIERLKARRLVDERYPRTASLEDFANQVLWGLENVKALSLQTAADWAAQAARVWMDLGQTEYANDALGTGIRALIKMAEEETYLPEEALALVQPLLPILVRFAPEHQAMLQELQGVALIELARYPEAYLAHEAANRLLLEARQPLAATWNLGKMAWCMGQSGQKSQAMALHRQAWTERLEQQNTPDAAWNLGQLARHTAQLSGPDAAWTILDADLDKVAGQEATAIQQLGDIVADAAQDLGEPAAFALGKALLQGLAARPQWPQEPALRALWIDMVEMAVPHTLQRELLDEWPSLFEVATLPSLAALNTLLRDWLDDLDTPAEQRAARRQTLDPDLATTLEGLAQALPRDARRRLGLQKSQSDPATG